MLALTSNPVPGVKNTIPRGEFLLKKFAGNRFGAEKASGTASQLISRWPVADGGPAMLLGFPKKFLKAFTVFRISAAVAPDASNTCGAAEAATGLKMSVKPSMAIASESECLFMIFMDCIGLIKIEVELLLLLLLLLLADGIAAYGPNRPSPGHAVEKAAAIDSVVLVIVRNVIGHNIGSWLDRKSVV